jgi:hypothetical protein
MIDLPMANDICSLSRWLVRQGQLNKWLVPDARQARRVERPLQRAKNSRR